MRLLSVNIGTPRSIEAKSGQSGIFKVPVSEPVQIGALGLSGDHIVDTENHGGLDQAVYVFTQPDYDFWSQLLGRVLAPGTFGENLLVSDLESAPMSIGERLHVGEVVLEITSARIPCVTLAVRMNDPQFVKTFRRVRRPGFYARVISEGKVQAGQPVTLEGQRPLDGPSVLDTFEYYYSKFHTPAEIEHLLSAPLHRQMRAQLEAELSGR
ncbi:MOSC domain-containing protein [Deinococcus ruber]|uniref:MOSC domain-containing protein n=1 Tax=Deinococcus ruber TaxID=1848197 RepID=A0A918CGB0_9DEIO|nr:MOSC domain-containing protein [Deinococcus ruber]GGR22388.1 MOSC domain-containing protein [Deinococcus ruber]